MAVCSDTGCDKDSSVKRSSNTGVEESFATGQKRESGYKVNVQEIQQLKKTCMRFQKNSNHSYIDHNVE